MFMDWHWHLTYVYEILKISLSPCSSHRNIGTQIWPRKFKAAVGNRKAFNQCIQWKYNAAISEATRTVSVRRGVSVFMSTVSQIKNKIFLYTWKITFLMEKGLIDREQITTIWVDRWLWQHSNVPISVPRVYMFMLTLAPPRNYIRSYATEQE